MSFLRGRIILVGVEESLRVKGLRAYKAPPMGAEFPKSDRRSWGTEANVSLALKSWENREWAVKGG